jgi:recombinational DNA repair protein (RecF pathway)
MQCAKCHTPLTKDEAYYDGQDVLCEDCYLDKVAQPKTCDPWAVFHAKNTSDSQDLTTTQEQLLNLLRNNPPLSEHTICQRLGLNQDDFLNNFATLRHMELAKACQINGQKYFTLFDAEEA